MTEEGFKVVFVGDESPLEASSKAAAQSLGNVGKAAEAMSKIVATAGSSLNKIVDGNGNITKSLSSLEAQLKRFQNGLADATNIKSFERLQRAIKETQTRITAVKSFGFDPKPINDTTNALDKLKKANGSATQSLVNLSRVAQDAPFGIIGIANNLNPLLESFQRLQVESKAAGVSMGTTLKNALVGPAGIGLALGIVSSLLIAFGDKLFSTKSAAEKQADAVKAAKEALASYVESLEDTRKANLLGTQNAQGELVKLKTLYEAAQNANIPLAKRKQIVDELQEQYPKYFKNLSDEAILAGKGQTAYENLAAAILASSRARAAQDTIVELQKQLLTIEQQVADKQTEQLKNIAQLNKERQKFNKTPAASGGIGGASAVGSANEIASAEKKILETAVQTNTLLENQTKLRNRINKLAKQATEIIEKNPDAIIDPTGNLDPTKNIKKAKVNFFEEFFDFNYNSDKINEEQRSQLLKAVKKFQDDFRNIYQGLDFNVADENGLQLARQFWENYKQGIVKFKPNAFLDDSIELTPPPIVLREANIEGLRPKLEPKIDVDDKEVQRNLIIDKYRQIFAEAQQKLPKKIKAGKTIVDLDLTFSPDAVEKGLDDASKLIQGKLKLLNEAIGATVQDMASQTASSIGEALGTALAGGNISDVFKGLFASLGGIIQQLGTQMIALSPLVQAIKTAIKSFNPAGMLAAGVGLVALGTAVKTAFSRAPGLAGGGIIPAGFEGDKFPAMLNSGEAVIPLDKIHQYLGTGGSDGSEYAIVGVLRGNDIELQRKRVQRRNSRTR